MLDAASIVRFWGVILRKSGFARFDGSGEVRAPIRRGSVLLGPRSENPNLGHPGGQLALRTTDIQSETPSRIWEQSIRKVPASFNSKPVKRRVPPISSAWVLSF